MVMEIVISLIILLVGIAVLVSIHFCVVGRAFGRDDNNNNNNDDGETQHGNNNNNMKGGGDLKNLPCFDYEETEKGNNNNNNNLVDCAVCLENFKVGDKCRLMPNCSHSFHVQCIDSWIIKTPFCPICRTWIHQTPLPVVEIEMS